MKLIGSRSSPYVRKVRIVMAEKKLDYQFVEEDVWNSDTILASNPLGKVPCLVMEGGEAVFDSRVIVEYLDAQAGGGMYPEFNSCPKLADLALIPADSKHRGRFDTIRLIAAPYLAGGGATASVGPLSTTWQTGPARHEGGSPNVLGAVALAAACAAIRAIIGLSTSGATTRSSLRMRSFSFSTCFALSAHARA